MASLLGSALLMCHRQILVSSSSTIWSFYLHLKGERTNISNVKMPTHTPSASRVPNVLFSTFIILLSLNKMLCGIWTCAQAARGILDRLECIIGTCMTNPKTRREEASRLNKRYGWQARNAVHLCRQRTA